MDQAGEPDEGESPSARPTLRGHSKGSVETGIRLNRFLAAAGLGSRRSCEEHILKGRVSINGSFRRDLSTRVLPGDDVRVNGRVVKAIAPRTILLNKPAGYTTTRSDRHAERTIFDLLPSDTGHLFHVGRLDKESEGLLLLTNDGALAQELMHPSKGIDKEYEVIVDKVFTSSAAAALKKGTWIEGSMAKVEAIRQLAPNKIQIVLHQGLKRQIRVMLGQLGYEVQRLIRTRLGPLTLRGVKPGSYRDLRKEDLDMLRKELAAPRPPRTKPTAKPEPLFGTIPTSSLSKEKRRTRSPRGASHGKTAPGRVQKPARKTSPTATRMRKTHR